jgi:DNA-binding protein HU-beta
MLHVRWALLGEEVRRFFGGRRIYMNKPQLVSYISKQAGINKKAATAVVNAVVGVIQTALKNPQGKIRIADLGTFRVIEMEARRGVNPRTREEMTIPPMKLPRFYAAKSLRETVQGEG